MSYRQDLHSACRLLIAMEVNMNESHNCIIVVIATVMLLGGIAGGQSTAIGVVKDVGFVGQSILFTMAERSKKHMMIRQRFCLNIGGQKGFNGYTPANAWCPQFMYDNTLFGVPYMTDAQLYSSQRTCEQQKLNGRYRVLSPNGKEHIRFSCMDLAELLRQGWNQ
jgi:hypothetical protein